MPGAKPSDSAACIHLPFEHTRSIFYYVVPGKTCCPCATVHLVLDVAQESVSVASIDHLCVIREGADDHGYCLHGHGADRYYGGSGAGGGRET